VTAAIEPNPALALAMIRAVVDLLAAMVELGVPLEDAQSLLSDLAAAAQMATDACVLVESGPGVAAQAIGWQDEQPRFSDDQLAAAAGRGSALQSNGAHVSVFHRIASADGEFVDVGECIDVVCGHARPTP
jgi:hypothetical protein